MSFGSKRRKAAAWRAFTPRLLAACERIRLAFDLFGSVIMRWTITGDGLQLEVLRTVPDRDTGERVHISLVQTVTAESLLIRYYHESMNQELVRWLVWMARTTLHEAARHEVDEMLHLDGRRAREPHEEDSSS